MFDLGWQEFLVIAFVLVIVVGPKDLPKVLKTITGYLKQIRQMAGEFHKGIESLADEADLKDVKQGLNQIKNTDFENLAKQNVDPGGEVAKALQQAKYRADLANEANKVEETFKTAGEESVKPIGKALKNKKEIKPEVNSVKAKVEKQKPSSVKI